MPHRGLQRTESAGAIAQTDTLGMENPKNYRGVGRGAGVRAGLNKQTGRATAGRAPPLDKNRRELTYIFENARVIAEGAEGRR